MLKKGMIITILMVSMIVCGLQLASPVSAAKLIDHGSHTYYIKDYKTTWKTYQYNKNHIIIKINDYVNNNLDGTTKITLQKVSNKKLKFVLEVQSKRKNEYNMMVYSYSIYTEYKKYSASALKYYYNKIRPDYIETIH